MSTHEARADTVIGTEAVAPGPPGYRKRYRRAVAASAIGWGLDGFDHTMFPLALSAILTTLGIDVPLGGVISTVSLVAAAVGGVFGGLFADRFGRARVLVGVIIGFSVFSMLSATAQNIEQLILWRVLEGLFFGAEWPVGVALLSEYANPDRRGRLMAFMQSAYSIGWAASTVGYFAIFSLLPPDIAWRVLFLVGVLPAGSVLYIRRNVHDRTTGKTTTRQDHPLAGIRALFRPHILFESFVASARLPTISETSVEITNTAKELAKWSVQRLRYHIPAADFDRQILRPCTILIHLKSAPWLSRETGFDTLIFPVQEHFSPS